MKRKVSLSLAFFFTIVFIMISKFLLLTVAVPALIAVQWLRPYAAKESRVLPVPPKDLVNYTLGFDDALASLFWVRAVQDLEICDQSSGSEEERPNYDRTYKDPLDRVMKQKLPPSRCHRGWVYHMIDMVTDFDPSFQAAYSIGGSFLSVAVDDRVGANAILHKGTEYFPENWRVLFTAAYHELFEMKNLEASAQLMHKAAKRGAPPWIYSLTAGLYTKMGRARFAKSMLEKVQERKPKGPMAHRIQLRLEEIEKILKNETTAR